MCQNAMGPLTREGAAWTAAVGYGGAEGSHPPDSCNRRFPPVYRASHNCKPLEGRPMRKLVVSVVAVMAVAGCQDGRTPAGPDREARVQADAGPASTAEVIPGQYIVVLKPTAQDVSAIARDLVAAHGGTLRFTYTHALQGFSAQLSDAAAAVLAQHPLVAYVEPNQMMHAITDQLNPPSWGLDRVDEHDLPLDNVYTYNATGAGVKVYIIDTGIRKTHVDFGGRAITGVDEITPGGTADDCNGHGTHVSGTVGGATYGIAKEVTLVAVRVLDCSGSGTTDQVIAGVDWVTGDHLAGQVVSGDPVDARDYLVGRAASRAIEHPHGHQRDLFGDTVRRAADGP